MLRRIYGAAKGAVELIKELGEGIYSIMNPHRYRELSRTVYKGTEANQRKERKSPRESSSLEKLAENLEVMFPLSLLC